MERSLRFYNNAIFGFPSMSYDQNAFILLE